MFDDFRTGPMSREERTRMGGSVAVAVIVYFSLGALLIGTTAATRQVVEKLTQVEFATKVPEPPPPPPPPPVVAAAQPPQNARPKTKRHELKPPDHVPDEKPKESNEKLTDAEPSGPVDGFLTGIEGGTGTARTGSVGVAPPPPPKPEPLILPVESKSNTAPQYSAAARRKEVEGVVVVAFDVLENGTVANPSIVSGPAELRDTVLKIVVTWHFQPARRGNKPVRYRLTKSIRFRLSDE
jgi:periplasmic protein TonB